MTDFTEPPNKVPAKFSKARRVLGAILKLIGGTLFLVAILVFVGCSEQADSGQVAVLIAGAGVVTYAIGRALTPRARPRVQQRERDSELVRALWAQEFCNELFHSSRMPEFLVAIIVLCYVAAAAFGWNGSGIGGVPTYEAIGISGAGFARGEYWRLITYSWFHAGLLHLVFNLTALSQLAKLCERFFGWRRTLVIYLLSGIFGGAAMLLGHPAVIGVGASGAIWGLLGAIGVFVVLRPKEKRGPMIANLQRGLRNAIFVNLAISLLPGISLSAHVGGFISGILLGIALRPQTSPPEASPRF